MTPTETILALEKALAAADELDPGHSPFFIQSQVYRRLEAVCNPVAIRTLLDAHASALRDAVRYRWLRGKGIVLEGHDFVSFDDTADFRIDRAMAALDDNTKGAMSHG